MYDQARAGFLRDVSSVVPDSYLDTVSAAAADAFTFEGQRVGLPLQVSQVAWWYNKDLMSQAGIDVSQIKMWDDLLDAVKQIKAAGITLFVWVVKINGQFILFGHIFISEMVEKDYS